MHSTHMQPTILSTVGACQFAFYKWQGNPSRLVRRDSTFHSTAAPQGLLTHGQGRTQCPLPRPDSVACSLRHVVIMSIMAHADTHDSNVGVRTQVRKIVRADGPSVLLHMGFIDATRVHKLLPKLGRPSRINLWEERGIRAIG